MRKIAHVEKGKIVNISLHETMPSGKQFLDVTENDLADIGDAVSGKQIVSKRTMPQLPPEVKGFNKHHLHYLRLLHQAMPLSREELGEVIQQLEKE